MRRSASRSNSPFRDPACSSGLRVPACVGWPACLGQHRLWAGGLPFAGPQAVLADLSRYTHRVAISNSRLLAPDDRGVTFRWKAYRARDGATGRAWIKTMTLGADEFIRRFLLHVLPDGFHRIRHSGLFASGTRAANIARIRNLLAPVPSDQANPQPAHDEPPAPACPCCGGRLFIVDAPALGCTRGRIRPLSSGSTRHDPRPEHDCASPIERETISHPGSPRPRSRHRI